VGPARYGPGHVGARLGDRAAPAAAERGFRLLREREALAHLLAQRAADDARFDADVVAFALADGDAPPHVLVDRAGRGVTCLGPGMAVDAPVLPFAVTTAFLDGRARLLQARRAVLAEHEAPAHQAALVRAVEHPHRLVRDELLVLRALTPLLGVAHHAAAIEAAVGEVVAVVRGERASERGLQASWRLVMGGAASLLVAGHEPPMFGAAVAAVATGDPHLGVPAVWQLVHHPAQTLRLARAVVEADDATVGTTPNTTLPATLHATLLATLLDTVLPALACRCAAFARDADAVARLLQQRLGLPTTGLEDEHAAALDFARQLVLLLPLVLRQVCPDAVAAAQLVDGVALAGRLQGCRTVDDVWAEASPWTQMVLGHWRLAARRAEPPRTTLRATSSLTDGERVATALWRAAVVEGALPVRGAGPFFACLVAHAPVEALLPGDEPEPAWALSRGVARLRALPALLGAPATSSPPTGSRQERRAARRGRRR
jgi:hypothetical protein